MRVFKRQPQNGNNNNGQRDRFSFFVQGVLSGLGWSFGATIGFAFVFGIITFVLAQLGALPVIGQFFTDLRNAIDQLSKLRETLPR